METLDYLPFCRVYVAESEFEDYKKQNKGADIVAVPNKVQGNLCRIRNYILDEEFKNNADVVLIIDDDMKGVYYWENNKKHIVEASDFLGFIEKYSIMAKDIGAYFWGVNINCDKKCYREMTPFSTISYIGGPFQCFLKGGSCRYDERLPLKEDYDMTLQQLNKYRVAFRVNKFFYDVKQSQQAGGCASYRNLVKEKEQFELLQKKWGKKIVKIDKQSVKKFDYNPIIKVPIKGV